MEQIQTNQQVQDCLLPMGITSENVAERYGVSRQSQDEAAVNFFFEILASNDTVLCLLFWGTSNT